MNYPSIRIEGSILSHDILERIEDMPGQKPIDFGFDSSSKVKDEIARAWADAQDYWRIFQRKIETLKPDSAATTETRQQWVVPLLGLLGYQLEYQPKGAELNGKIYNISHIASNRSLAPVQIIGYREPAGLDRKPERSKLRMSAHAIVQEFLNLNDQLYGLVTNGRVLRLLRDSSRLIKLSYLEFDLDRIFTDGLFADFAILYRLLHATRLPVTNDTAAESLIERYHQDTIEQGTRIREGLRAAVTEALEILGTGFLAHPENQSLRGQIDTGALEHTAFFSHLLRLIYRLLFLNVVEERGLIFAKGTPATRSRTYFDYYSVQRLRRLARTRGLKTERHHDAWLSLLSTFQLFERPEKAMKLGTTAFGGQLFDPQSLGPLSRCRLTNAALFDALDRLCSFDDPKTKQRLPVNFGALATEEFGSVYESLLELHPTLETTPSPHFSFKESAGNDRKTSGSYYTPTSLVDCLLGTALDPVLGDRVRKYAALGYPSAEAAILALKVCDPACGSGHFLIAAAQRIARRLAQIRAGDDEPSPDQLRHALREVISKCIYAVDINPMSVELCRIALWLEAVEPGKPLSFLDHHIRVGNSLLGTTPQLIAAGLPDETFTAIEGDDKKACAVLKKRNRTERGGLGPLFIQQDAETQAHLQQSAAALADLPDDRPEEIRAKELAFRLREQTDEYRQKKQLADTWCAAFVIKKYFREPGREANASGITQGHLNDLAAGHPLPADLTAEVALLFDQYQFFHWHLAFPEVFAKGGFDCVLGNPPWEKLTLMESEFFASRNADIAAITNKAARGRAIEALIKEDPDLHAEWLQARRSSAGSTSLIQRSNRFPRSSAGELNTYLAFTELGTQIVGPIGRTGLIVKSSIFTADTATPLLSEITAQGRLVSLFDFRNWEGLFPGVGYHERFSLVTLTGDSAPAQTTKYAFYCDSVAQLTEGARAYTISREEIALLSPNSGTCPTLTTRRDLQLMLRVSTCFPVLVDDQTGANSWSAVYGSLFHMSGASDLYRTKEQQDQTNAAVPPFGCYDGESYAPLYEGKFIQIYDHRFSSFEGVPPEDRFGKKPGTHSPTQVQKDDPSYAIVPRYWIPVHAAKERAVKHLGEVSYYCAARRVTNVISNARTVMACVMPLYPANDMIIAFKLQADNRFQYGPKCALFVSLLNSFSFDYFARLRVSENLLKNVLEEVRAPSSEDILSYLWPGDPRVQFVSQVMLRCLELTYTTWELEPFARDCGWSGPPFRWDEERRFLLRCELDAAFFHLYLTADKNGGWIPAGAETTKELAQLKASFPTPRDAVAYIMDTFPIVKRKDEEKWGDFRTKRVILEIYDALSKSIRTGQPYQTRLDPAPADPSMCHPPKDESEELLLVEAQ